MSSHDITDRLSRWLLPALAGLLMLALVAMSVELAGHAASAFSRFGVALVFGDHWSVPAAIFRAGPLLAGSLIVTVIAGLIGVPVAIAIAHFLTEICPGAVREPVVAAFDLLAAIPSVVFGLWMLRILAPWLASAERSVARTLSFIPWIGGGHVAITNCLVAGLVLAIMIVPVVATIVRQTLESVPREQRGARWAGIAGGALIGLGRAVGETIAVVLVIGDNPQIARHLFGPADTLTAVIPAELGEATGLQRSALAAVGLLLLLLSVLFSMSARTLLARAVRARTAAPTRSDAVAPEVTGHAVRGLSMGLTVLGLLPLVLVLLELVRKGVPALSASFFTHDPTGAYSQIGGARSAIIGSLELVVMAALMAVPAGIGVALYLTGARRTDRAGRPFARAVSACVDVIAGLPPIVCGVFVYLTLVLSHTGGDFNGWKGAVALGLVMLPLVISSAARTFEHVSWSVGDLGRGALLAMARGVGEAAPLLFTAATPNGLGFNYGRLTLNPSGELNSLPVQMFSDITSPLPAARSQAWACGLILVIIIALLNLAARTGAPRLPSLTDQREAQPA